MSDAGADGAGAPGRLLRGLVGSRRRLAANLVLLALVAGAWMVLDVRGWLEARMAYYPSREAFETPAGIEDVEFATEGGKRLHGWLMPAVGGAGERRPTIIHVHGNAGHVAGHAELSAFLTQAGFHVLVFDYRGYGRSQRGGRITRAKLVADTNAAIDYLLTREDVDRQRIGMLGYSLGGVIGLAAAAERDEIRAVVACAAFSSWKAIARDHLGPGGALLARPGVDADAAAGRLGERPLLIVHGTADGIVPVEHAGRLEAAATAAGVPVEALIVEGADHMDVLDPARVRSAVIGFLGEALVRNE
ncbi:MAG: alpha/beta hydrolase [Phycisphaerales bacterium JB039]